MKIINSSFKIKTELFLLMRCIIIFTFLITFTVEAQSNALCPVIFKNQFLLSNEKQIDLKVGVGKANITPDVAIKNWVTGKSYEGIEDSIYVQAIVLTDGSTEVVLITWDLTDAGESATEEVRKAISAKLQIPVDNILLNASHNHSAPWSPVYKSGYRGKEKDTWWAVRYMTAQNAEPHFKKWMKFLIDQTVVAVAKAHNSIQPAEVWIGRADASKYMNNRRPRQPEWGILEDNVPQGYNYKHEKYNPQVVVGGASYGPMDRTMVLLSFRDAAGKNIVSIFHAAIHGVSIYPYSQAISGDWPQEASKQISREIGGSAFFFQGAAGDINPWKRGKESVIELGKGLADLAKEAYEYSARLAPGKLDAVKSKVWLPLSPLGKERTGLDSVAAEVQVISYGSLAFVTLPGEPLTELGTKIRENSPFPQTLVFGYSNGNGVHYVSLPKEKKYGGYEVEIGTSGTEQAGRILVTNALMLLDKAKKNQGK